MLRVLLAGALLVSTGSFLAGSALANTNDRITHFKGTRDQVRKACTNIGGVATEGGNYTECLNTNNGNTVSCDSKGNCTGKYSSAFQLSAGDKLKVPTVTLLMSK